MSEEGANVKEVSYTPIRLIACFLQMHVVPIGQLVMPWLLNHVVVGSIPSESIEF